MLGNKRLVLVTGAGGFVGSHLVELLVNSGFQVRCFLRYTSRGDLGCLETLPLSKKDRLEVIHGDIRDADVVNKAVVGAYAIFHLAALVGTHYSLQHPREVIETNTLGTLNVLTAARAFGVRRIIYVSSSEVYGPPAYVPVDENHPLRALTPYAASKIAAEQLIESFRSSYDLSTTIIRPFNIYGPRQLARAVIPTIISQILMSSEVRLGKVTTTRDFTYVADTVLALVQTLENDEVIGRTLNIGSNRETSILRIVERVAALLGKKISIRQEDSRYRSYEPGMQQLRGDNTLAHQLLGWQPMTSLDEGLISTIQWIEANIERFRIGKYEI